MSKNIFIEILVYWISLKHFFKDIYENWPFLKLYFHTKNLRLTDLLKIFFKSSCLKVNSKTKKKKNKYKISRLPHILKTCFQKSTLNYFSKKKKTIYKKSPFKEIYVYCPPQNFTLKKHLFWPFLNFILKKFPALTSSQIKFEKKNS